MSDSVLQKRIALDRTSPMDVARKPISDTQNLWYLCVDLLFVNLVYWVLFQVSEVEGVSIMLILTFFGLLNLTWLISVSLQKAYSTLRWTYLQSIQRLVMVLLTHIALLFLVSFLLFQVEAAYELIIRATALSAFVLALARLVQEFIAKRNVDAFNYIIIGGKGTKVQAIKNAFGQTYANKAFCLGRFGELPVSRVRNLGIEENLIDYIQYSNNIQRVVYVDSAFDNNELEQLTKICSAKFIDFMLVPRESDLFSKGLRLQTYGDLLFLSPERERIARLPYQILKRLFDIVFSFLVIVFILSWLIPLVTLLIKLESRGPVFFIQKRTGYFNNHFSCIKFRSMQVNEECDDKQATQSDTRITRIGAFLRRTNIDEFPQFINVFLGQMSVVGPRPHMLKHTHEYSKLIKEFMIRHSVKPGITGWAQVNGHRGPTETVDKMRMRVEHDIWYIENWSFFLDLKCVFMTSFNVIKGEENAF